MRLEAWGDGCDQDLTDGVMCCPRCECPVEETGYDTCRCPDCRWTGMLEQTVVFEKDYTEEPVYVTHGEPVG